MSLTPYPTYRPSGAEWLGQLPEHWEVKPLGVLAENRESGVAEQEASIPLSYVGLEHIESWTGRLLRVDPDFEPSASSNRFEVGDILYGKLRPYLAKVCRVDFKGMCSSELLALRPEPDVDGRFLCYFLLTDGFTSWMTTCSYGTKMPRTSWTIMKRCATAVPNLEEQRAIATYLDGETAMLDAIVRKEQTLVERLREKRSALITETVTRGLPPDAARAAGFDPHPPLKQSGIEWLGDIPAHWKVGRLRHFLAKNESGVWGDDADSGGTPVLRSTEQTVEGGWRIRKPAIRLLSEAERNRYRLERGDLVVTTSSGSARHIGKTSLVTDAVERLNACFSNFMQRLRCSESLEPRLAYYLLNSPTGREQLVFQSSTTTGLANLNGAVLSNVWLAVPPAYPEQRALADYLDRETAGLDALVAKIETAIERLREYRSALITAAVTGKVDVRSARRPTPACASSAPEGCRTRSSFPGRPDTG